MSNYGISIELTKLREAQLLRAKDGRMMLCIDVTNNPYLVVKDTKAYFNLKGIQRKQVSVRGETHFIVPATPQEYGEAPILGNIVDWDLRKKMQERNPYEPAPRTYHPYTQRQTQKFESQSDDDDDMPF